MSVDGEQWYEKDGYSIRLEKDGPSIAYQVFFQGSEIIAGIESEGEERIFRFLETRLK